jgi:hypothetical protein
VGGRPHAEAWWAGLHCPASSETGLPGKRYTWEQQTATRKQHDLEDWELDDIYGAEFLEAAVLEVKAHSRTLCHTSCCTACEPENSEHSLRSRPGRRA